MAFKNCKKCKKDLIGKQKVRVNGYTRSCCRECLNKESLKKQKEKSKRLREWRKWYA
tara:strand:+ start:1339 stop:1509 length:171 start_codon:yes stop_codon:yes gene_type:complete